MSLVIKKRVSLDFLGDDYKDSYLILRAMSVQEYDSLENDKKQTVKDAVCERLIEGQINQDGSLIKITQENIKELPGDVFVKAWGAILGEEIDPKSLAQ